MGAFRYQVIDEDPNIGLVAPNDHRSQALDPTGGVNPGDQPLSGSFFVARGPIDLAGEEEGLDFLGFEGGVELGRWGKVVFHGIGRPEHDGFF